MATSDTPRRVRIASVELKDDRVLPGRVIYTIRLACGCTWVEHRDSHAPAPEVGIDANCYKDHTGSSGVVM